jgi:HEAT repeat protein
MLPPMRSCLTALFFTVLVGPLLASDPPQAQKAWDILEAGVTEKSATKRHDAIQAMGLLAGDSKAVAIAEKALDDHAPEVREAAANTLGRLHSTSSIPKLDLALNDKEVSVVLAAAHSLWALRDKQGLLRDSAG